MQNKTKQLVKQQANKQSKKTKKQKKTKNQETNYIQTLLKLTNLQQMLFQLVFRQINYFTDLFNSNFRMNTQIIKQLINYLLKLKYNQSIILIYNQLYKQISCSLCYTHFNCCYLRSPIQIVSYINIQIVQLQNIQQINKSINNYSIIIQIKYLYLTCILFLIKSQMHAHINKQIFIINLLTKQLTNRQTTTKNISYYLINYNSSSPSFYYFNYLSVFSLVIIIQTSIQISNLLFLQIDLF
ncbi:hypothetical protein ABPG74_002593 [Tetrahymena malaccensis]